MLEKILNPKTFIELTNKLNEIIDHLNNTNQKKDERWKPEAEEKYYFFDGGLIVCASCWLNDDLDSRRYEAHNCFKTEQEAKQARDKVKELLISLH